MLKKKPDILETFTEDLVFNVSHGLWERRNDVYLNEVRVSKCVTFEWLLQKRCFGIGNGLWGTFERI